jgi:hypothetical protein
MRDLKNKTKLLNNIRWVSRIWGIVYIVFFLFMLIGYAIMDQPSQDDAVNPLGTRVVIAFIFVFGYFAGLILAWKWEGLGGLIAITCIISFAITIQNMPVHIYMLMAIPALLFLICWYLSIETSIKPE